MKCWAMLMTLSLMSVIIAPIILINPDDGKCQVKNMSGLLGADKKDEYLLYGINIDCHLFFAMRVLDDIDLGKELNGQTVDYDQGKDCSDAKIQPMIDVSGHLRLVITNTKLNKYKAVDFLLPSKDDWLIMSKDAIADMYCATCSVKAEDLKIHNTAVITNDGFMSSNLKQLSLPTKMNTTGNSIIVSYQLQDGKLISVYMNDQFPPLDAGTITMADDPYSKSKYVFVARSGIYVTKWENDSVKWLLKAIHVQTSQPHIVNNKLMGVRKGKITVNEINQPNSHIFIKSTTCIGQFNDTHMTKTNFQMSALLKHFFTQISKQSITIMTSKDTTTTSRLTTTVTAMKYEQQFTTTAMTSKDATTVSSTTTPATTANASLDILI